MMYAEEGTVTILRNITGEGERWPVSHKMTTTGLYREASVQARGSQNSARGFLLTAPSWAGLWLGNCTHSVRTRAVSTRARWRAC